MQYIKYVTYIKYGSYLCAIYQMHHICILNIYIYAILNTSHLPVSSHQCRTHPVFTDVHGHTPANDVLTSPVMSLRGGPYVTAAAHHDWL